MTDKKVSDPDLTEITPTRDDLLYVVNGPLGTPASRKATTQAFICGPALLVAASDAQASETKNADYVCDGADDDMQIQAAIDAAPANGRLIRLSSGTFTLGAAMDLTSAPGVQVIGAGRGATELTGEVGYTDALVQIGTQTGLQRCTVTIPTTVTANAIQAYDVDSANGGFVLRDLYVQGGADANAYAISVRNPFYPHVENVTLRVGCNGWEIANTANVYNYGNGTFTNCEVVLTRAARIGWDIHGYISGGVHNYNLTTFNYISTITGAGAGSTGILVRNCINLIFIMADIEGVDTAVDIRGQVGAGGCVSKDILFIGGYLNQNVSIDANSHRTTFVNSRIYGTITDAQATPGYLTQYFGAANGSEKTFDNAGAAANVADGGTIAHNSAVTPTGAIATGSVANEFVSVTGIDATNLTVAIKKHDGSAGTAQTIYWRAWV